MASITYTSLTALQPVELKYQYYKDETLSNSRISFNNGYSFYQNDSFIGYRDTTINRESVFILTSAVNLNTFFNSQETFKLGKLPGTILLRPRTAINYYAALNTVTNTIILSQTENQFTLSPVSNSNEVELLTNNRYLQVEENYPFTVYTDPQSLSQNAINRQRFEYVFQNSTITLKTRTKNGYRYLAFNNDNTLRATGVILNNSTLNDYVLSCTPVTTSSFSLNFSPANTWVTYYLEYNREKDNKSVTVNKEYITPTNMLINFPIEKAVKTGKAYLNVANLKTGVTPLGGPAPVDNLPNT